MNTITNAPHRAGWPDFSSFQPHPSSATLSHWLRQTQALTDVLLSVVTGDRLHVPRIRIVNPPLWETGHVAWFQEFWMHRRGRRDAPSMLANADQLYDSARVAHDTRWSLPLPDMEATRRYGARVLADSLEMLDRGPLTDELAYFTQLSILHQDMHNEAFCYMWQTLGYPLPLPAPPRHQHDGAAKRRDNVDIEIPAGRMLLGAAPRSGFVFDNEKWAHAVEVPAFAIARDCVSNAEYLAFVEDGGYQRREFWSESGLRMLDELRLSAPRYWRRNGQGWRVRRFDAEPALDLQEPVMHVSFHEAQAWCRWARRRLPTEAEWERAAATQPGGDDQRRFPWGETEDPGVEQLAHLDARGAGPVPVDALPEGCSGWGLRQMVGNVWEWTASRFLPYPGFSADPYIEYSSPWFTEDHRVLRGGSFATPLRLIRNTWRNFYMPQRADMFCGFRTCAV